MTSTFMPKRLYIRVRHRLCDRKHDVKDPTAMNISRRKTNCQYKLLAIDMLSR